MPRLDVLYFIRRLYVGRHRDKAVKTARVQAAIVIRCAAVHWVPVFEVFIFEDFSILRELRILTRDFGHEEL